MSDNNDLMVIKRRLKRVEGQVRGIEKMVDERECSEIINQISAARNALNKVAYLLLQMNLKECIQQMQNGETSEENIDKLLRNYLTYNK